MKFVQAPRTERDGEVQWRRKGDGDVEITCVHEGQTQTIVCSEYNAARLLGMLAFTLGIKLPTAVEKAIVM